MIFLGVICIVSALCILYLKYRVVFTGEKSKGKIIGMVDENTGYRVGGVSVKKHSYIVQIKHKNYYTAHGCIFVSFSKRKIGNEIFVFKNEKYGNEVFECFDFRIEVCSILMLLFSVFCIYEGLI
ncbi:MAG: hypothetical protein PHN80_03345 [Hespellia sp.]|nr:hypothetical protein [Hespellia sp.]